MVGGFERLVRSSKETLRAVRETDEQSEYPTHKPGDKGDPVAQRRLKSEMRVIFDALKQNWLV